MELYAGPYYNIETEIKINLNNLKSNLIRPYRPYKSFVCIKNNKEIVRDI